LNEVLIFILFVLIGVVVGLLSGLIPGLHVNTLSVVILSMQPSLLCLLKGVSINGEATSLYLSALILSICSTHTFVNIIPATFLGVPDEDAALTLLPAHRLFVGGRGYEAIYLSALGSFVSMFLCASLLIPIRFILAEPLNLYNIMKENMVWILVSIIVIMVLTEKPKSGYTKTGILKAISGAIFVITLSGIYGLVIIDMDIPSPLSLPTSVLFPALAGLFGLSTLIYSFLFNPRIKEQDIRESSIGKTEKTESVVSIATGTLSGIVVSIVPGITGAIGTILALVARGKVNERQAIITLSSVNTSAAIATLACFYILQKTRSGVMVVISNLISTESWNEIFPPSNFFYLLLSMLIAGSLSLPLTCYMGKKIAENMNKIPYRTLLKVGTIFIVLLTILFTGILGLLILLTATAIGLIPIFLGVRRSNCMGILLVPLILRFL